MLGRFVTLLALSSLGAAFVRADTTSDCVRASDPTLRIRSCTSIISQDPSAARAFKYRAEAFFIRGDHSRALRDFSKAIKLDPSDPDNYANRGWVYATKGDYASAITDLNRALELQPNYAPAYDIRGVAYLRKGDHEHAVADFTRALELDPRFARAHYNRGLVYRARGNLDQAIADFTRAVEFDPRLALAYINRGEVYEAYERVRCPIGIRRIGDAPPTCAMTGAYDRALSDYSKAIELDPTNVLAYYSRGAAHWAKGEYDRSIADLTKAIELHGRSANSFTSRGSAYHMKGAYDLAIADYTKAIELDARSALAYYNRGEAYEDWGRVEQATADYRIVLTLPAMKQEHQAAERGLDRIARGPPLGRPAPDAAPPKNIPKTALSGTGILVSNDGAILTNAHVVPNCTTIQVNRVGSASVAARMVAADLSHDLALLKTETVVTSTISSPPFRQGARVGESVFAYGFPLAGYLPTSGNFTSGNITANAGLNDDGTKLQFSAPIQPGNSGGALLDRSGNIIGVVVATVDALKFAGATNRLPQNINFAIKASVAVHFLQSHAVMVNSVSHTPHLASEDVADRAAAISVHIVCN